MSEPKKKNNQMSIKTKKNNQMNTKTKKNNQMNTKTKKNNQMSIKTKKNNQTNTKTKKNNQTNTKTKNGKSIYDFYNHYNNTKSLPVSPILKYIKNNFDYNDTQKKYDITIDELFDFGNKMNSGKDVFSLDSIVNGKNNYSLDKLLAYCFYNKTKHAFLDNKMQKTTMPYYLEILKYQMGKDIRRDDRTINGVKYGRELYSDEKKNNYQITDLFYKTLIDHFNKFDKNIDYNKINKICLLSCQNIFNLITDLITVKLIQMLSPASNSVYRAKKSTNIIISQTSVTMEFVFDSLLIISQGENPINPEYPCGNLHFILLVDLNKQIYKFSSFKLNYDINKCGPPNENIVSTSNNGSNKLKYVIPGATVFGGLIATPFILGLLGGKHRHHNKKIKRGN